MAESDDYGRNDAQWYRFADAIRMLAKTHMCSGRDAKAIAYLDTVRANTANQTIIPAVKEVEPVGCS